MTDTTIELPEDYKNLIVEENVGETQNVKTFIKRSEPPLAELRLKTLAEICEIKCNANDYISGMAIGISPTDKVLNQFNRGEITMLITKIFKTIRERGVDGAVRPIGPLSLLLIGEHSPSHRWHYHGLIKVNNIVTLDHIKKRLTRVIGRTVTEQINNTENYLNYMFKQYECPKFGMFYKWDIKDCMIRMIKDINGKIVKPKV